MVEARKTHRAKITHKLAKYVRARPIHLDPCTDPQHPSISHLIYGGAQKKKLRNNAKTWYPADDQKKQFRRKRNQPKPSTRNVTPGTVVILLSGKHRGRRVVVLKNCSSGNLLVSGPYSINGVPLRRVNPAYTIVTSTKVGLEGINVTNIDDGWFKSNRKYRANQLKNVSEVRKKRQEELKKAEDTWKVEAKNVQKTVDGALQANVKKVESLKGYLGTRFTLYNNTKPHELKF